MTVLVSNNSEPQPRWALDRLAPGHHYTARFFQIKKITTTATTMIKYIFRMYAARPGQRSPPVVLDLHTRESPSRFLILPKDDS